MISRPAEGVLTRELRNGESFYPGFDAGRSDGRRPGHRRLPHGARGFLDLEHDDGSPAAFVALERLARFAPDGFGVKLGANAGQLLPRLLETSSRCREILLAGGMSPN